MPKFTLFWLLTYASGTLASLVNPLYGVLTYLFEYYLRPELHWWGQWLPDFRWNLIIALVTGGSYLVWRPHLRPLPPVRRGPVASLVLLGLWMIVMTPFAVSTELSWNVTINYWKLIAFGGLIVGVVRSEAAFDAFLAMSTAGAGWWGYEAWMDPRRVGSRLLNVGSSDTLNDNFAATHLLTVIPFICVYLLMHKDWRMKALALVSGPFVVNTFILCNSRGATLGLLAALGTGLFIAARQHRVRMVGASAAVLVVFYALADPQFIARQKTTADYENDSSAQGRLDSWRGGLALIQDYPLGAGGDGYVELSPVYIPDVVDAHGGEKRAPHNTVILVGSDWGIPGLVLYLAFYLTSFRMLREMRRRDPARGLLYYRAVAVQVAMVGVFVAGLFGDRLLGEAPYWMAGLAVALYRIQGQALVSRAASTGPTGEAALPFVRAAASAG